MTNKRKSVRVTTSRLVEILLSDGSSVEAVMVNISTAGICIHYAAAADMGSHLKVRFSLPQDEGHYKIVANVTVGHVHFYHDIYQIGLVFEALPSKDKKMLMAFIESKIGQINRQAGFVGINH